MPRGFTDQFESFYVFLKLHSFCYEGGITFSQGVYYVQQWLRVIKFRKWRRKSTCFSFSEYLNLRTYW